MVSRRISAAVCLLSFAVLSYEVALTRVFSALLQYHFAFLVISVAICGLGLGGLGLHVRRRWRPFSDSTLANSAASFGFTSTLALVLLLTVVIPHVVEANRSMGALLMLPFISAGAFLAEVFARHAEHSGRLYAADLLGAAVAAVATLATVQILGAPNAALLAGAVAAVAGWLCATQRAARARSVAACLIAVLVLVSNAATGWLESPAIDSAAKHTDEAPRAQPLFTRLSAPEPERPRILRTEWNAVIRTDVVEDPALGPRQHDVLQIYNNGNVPTRMLKLPGDLRRTPVAELVQPLIDDERIPPLAPLPFQIGRHDRALFIGPGGGMDVLLALLAGFQHIEGAELNPSIVPLMREYADWNGHVYERPEVDVVTAEGRSYLRRSDRSYDLIYGALTQSGTGTQGLALMESYIYTVEAFGEYWDHLSADGQLVFVVHNPMYVLRWVNTAAALLRRFGMSDVEILRHVMIAASPAKAYSYLFALKKTPYTEAEATALRAYGATHGIKPLHTPPLSGSQFDPVMLGGQSLAAFLDAVVATADVPFDISVTDDDRPFFMDLETTLPGSLVGLVIGAVAFLIVSSAVALLVRRRDKAVASGVTAGFLLYFALLGTGFMLIEIPLIQKLTLAFGYPTLALTATLFAVLLGGGLGSAVSQRIVVLRNLSSFAAVAALVGAVLALTIGRELASFEPLLGLPLAVRATVLIAILFALGFCLGVPFPTGMRLLGRTSETSAPWMWGVNGVTSVVGSVGAALGARLWGVSTMLTIGAAVYGVVALQLLWFRRRPPLGTAELPLAGRSGDAKPRKAPHESEPRVHIRVKSRLAQN